MVSILKNQNIRYSDMIKSNGGVTYTEQTNAFSYYIIKSIVMFHMNQFITWCNDNNTNIIKFTHTQENIYKYCDFIKTWHSDVEYLKTIEYVEKIEFRRLKTLRMTAFETL